MNHDGIIPVDVKNSDLQQRSIESCSDKHRQLAVHDDPAHSGADRVLYVGVGNVVLARWLPDPQIDNIPCLAASDQQRPCAPSRERPPFAPPSLRDLPTGDLKPLLAAADFFPKGERSLDSHTHSVRVGQTVEFFCDARAQWRMLLSESGRRVAPVLEVVKPNRPPDKFGCLPFVAWPDMRMHERVRIAENVDIHATESRISGPACAFNRRGQEVNIREKLHPFLSRHVSQRLRVRVLSQQHAVAGEKLNVSDDRVSALQLGQHCRVLAARG